MNILVINAGSSTVKYQLINMEDEEVLAKGNIDRIGLEGGPASHAEAIDSVIQSLGEHKVDSIGHRAVHGGEYFTESILIDDKMLAKYKQCIDFAPLHNPANITGMEVCAELMPQTPQVAVFDTAFHQTMPEKAYLYAIPREMYEKHKVRRYGAHGTSHKYVAQETAKMLGKPLEELKLITCHLGGGSSITAIKHGKSIDTSMGFTPLAGVMMGSRSGDIDPAIVAYLVEKTGKTTEDIIDMLNTKSGLFGISRVNSDFRDVGLEYLAGNKDAELALYMFAYHVKKYIGAYLVALNGADAIVFTGGVGERNPSSRRRILEEMDGIGIEFDVEKNKIRGQQIEVTAPGSKVRILVVPTNEELAIARETKVLTEKM